jgi:hypothetical protein
MDRAIKAEWYDLAEADRAAFLDWCHRDYCPRLQARAGHVWVGHYDRAPRKPPQPGQRRVTQTDDPGVPTGSQYLLLVAAATPDVFFDPGAGPDDAAAAGWLARRAGLRTVVYLEETRVSGPDWHRHMQGMAAPPAVQFGNFRTRSEADDHAISLWYRQRRLPQVTRTRGCIGARKLIAIVGWARHGILYEFADMEADESNFEQRFRAAPPPDGGWSGAPVLDVSIHAPHGAHAGRRLWPPR